MSKKFYLSLSENLGLVRSAYVDAEKGRAPGQAEFYIDTGSPVSVLSPELTERMQIPVNKLDFSDTVALGGAFIDVAIIDPIELTFFSEETGAYGSVEIPIYVSNYTYEKPKDRVDNVLGMTFFANTSADLHLETEERDVQAYIELD
jgi:hypothetical protein